MRMISQKKAVIFVLIVLISAFISGALIGRNFIPGQIIFPKRVMPFPESVDRTIDYDLFWRVWSTVKERYITRPISDQDLFYGSLKGLVSGLKDPYSVFLEPRLAKKFMEEMAGGFEGVGIEIGIKNNRLTVIAPLFDTPAFRAGLMAGDKIYAIDGADTSGISLDEAASLIRGERGTMVVLTIWRSGQPKTEDVEIIRDTIDIKTVSWELTGKKIAYLKISHFTDDTWKDFQDIARVILMADPNGLILDLRNNPGGYLDTAVNTAGYWLDKELVVISRDARAREKKYRSRGRGDFKHLPTIVLVNQGSASASEILAGALQDYRQAIILGEKTFGKGSVQELKSFSDGSALKLTVAYWYTPLGRSIDEEGIVPDIEVELTEEDYKANRDPQRDRALEILERGLSISE